MPIYVYKCPKCGAEKELICSLAKRPKMIKCECRTQTLFTLMPRKMSSGSFSVNGFNEKNGYSGGM